jgi:hypothetical protein
MGYGRIPASLGRRSVVPADASKGVAHTESQGGALPSDGAVHLTDNDVCMPIRKGIDEKCWAFFQNRTGCPFLLNGRTSLGEYVYTPSD